MGKTTHRGARSPAARGVGVIGIAALALPMTYCGAPIKPRTFDTCVTKSVRIDARALAGAEPEVLLLCANRDNYVEWVSTTKTFSVDFENSPFRDGAKHFDQDHPKSTGTKALGFLDGKYKYFKYTVQVEGKTYDPGVIITK